MTDKGKLEFKPLSEGLGFHPFADGLPYSPAPKPTPRPVSGVGAVAAGLPAFARTLPKATPSVSPKTTTKATNTNRLPPRPSAKAKATPVQPVRPMAVEVVGEGGFLILFKRILAYGLDSTLNISICAVALAMSLANQGVRFDALYDWEIWFTGALFLLFFNWALILGQEIAFRSTLAKRLFGLTLKGSSLAVFVRGILFIPSALFCGIGLVWAFGDSRRRCWHDLATDAYPVEARA